MLEVRHHCQKLTSIEEKRGGTDTNDHILLMLGSKDQSSPKKNNSQLPPIVHLQGISLLLGLKSDLSISRDSAITSIDKETHCGVYFSSNTGAMCVCECNPIILRCRL